MANFENDYIMRMIRDMVRFIATIAFGRTDLMVDIDDVNKVECGSMPPSTLVYSDMLTFLEKGDINSAENLLFERLDTSDMGYLEAGLAFYHRLTDLDDDYLESCNYSREEILDGLKELSEMFGIAGLEQFE